MFVCTLRKGGLRKLAVVAVCGVVLAGAAITVGVVRNKGDAVDAAAQGGALSAIGEFGWGGAAGSYIMIDPDHRLCAFYAQHMLNNQEPYVHPRLRNLIYQSVF